MRTISRVLGGFAIVALISVSPRSSAAQAVNADTAAVVAQVADSATAAAPASTGPILPRSFPVVALRQGVDPRAVVSAPDLSKGALLVAVIASIAAIVRLSIR